MEDDLYTFRLEYHVYDEHAESHRCHSVSTDDLESANYIKELLEERGIDVYIY